MISTKAEKEFEILLVEDNPGDIRLIVETLKAGVIPHNISIVKDGEEAMRYLSEKSKEEQPFLPDVILLDLKLPKKSGMDVLEELKNNKKLKDIPVVVLTSSESPDDMVKAYEKKANLYVTKPIDLDRFIVTVNSIENFLLTVVKPKKE